MLIEPITPIDSPTEGMMIMQTTTELAIALDTTPRTLRKFLRSPDSGVESVGKGSRYALPSSKREASAMAKRFAAWDEARKATPVEADAPEGDTPEVPTED